MLPLRSRTTTRQRKTAERFGQRGEALAALFLRAKFYSIRHRRFKTPVGEIDLIAQRGRTLAFVEVKSRQSDRDFIEASEAVNYRRITRAAQFFLVKHPELQNHNLRFDVIFLAPGRWPRHLINAF